MSEQSKLLSADGTILSTAISEIRELLNKSRQNVATQVNQELLSTYWRIGEIIVRYEQNEQIRAVYGEETLRQFSKTLTREFGKGFSRSNVSVSYTHLDVYKRQQKAIDETL